MEISQEVWTNYIDSLRKVNDAAAREMFKYLATNEWYLNNQTKQAAVDFAFAVATKYGEAAASAACEMYDAIANNFTGRRIRPADPANTATYSETAKALYGAMKRTRNIEYLADVTGNLVKQASADTMTMNALRDGGEWAWIPSGDSCAYCTMLASRGWQRASKKALVRGHVQHIHAHCDCNYCARLDDSMNVAGYDPDALYQEYKKYKDENGNSWQAGLKAMRRDKDLKNQDTIKAQKHRAYEISKGDGTWKYN